jgi:hypothetical protein
MNRYPKYVIHVTRNFGFIPPKNGKQCAEGALNEVLQNLIVSLVRRSSRNCPMNHGKPCAIIVMWMLRIYEPLVWSNEVI